MNEELFDLLAECAARFEDIAIEHDAIDDTALMRKLRAVISARDAMQKAIAIKVKP